MDRPLFRHAVISARSHPAGAVVLPCPVPVRAAAVSAGAILLLLSLFLYFGEYARTVRVSGRIVPSAGSIAVVAPQGGRIARRLVASGAQVAAGEAMFELSAERTGTSGGIDSRIDVLLAARSNELQKQGKLQVEELSAHGTALAERERLIGREVESRRQEIVLHETQVRAARDRHRRFKQLARQGFMSAAQLSEATASVDAQIARRKQLESNVLAVERELLQVREEARSIANKIRQADSQVSHTLSAIKQESAEHEGRGRVLVIAPVTGLVAALDQPAGQTVSAGSQLATILPKGSELEAQLMVPSRAVGLVLEGQPVLLRIDAFAYQKYGPVRGVVARVEESPSAGTTRDAEPQYRVIVRLARQSVSADGAQHRFKAGMTLEADIIQDRRRLIEWVIDPLVSTAKGRTG